MAKLTNVYSEDEIKSIKIGRRQLPLKAGDNLVMLMDLNHKGLAIDNPHVRRKQLEEFTRKYNLLSADELVHSLQVNKEDFLAVLNQTVQCVGCRRSVERLMTQQLMPSGFPTLDPVLISTEGTVSICEERMKSPQALGAILYRHHETLNDLMENKLRNKTRCVIHYSLDTFRSRVFSETWREVWVAMKQICREELCVIEIKLLRKVLEGYLKKHKFCQECRTKVEKAFKLLVGESHAKEKGFVSALYSNIKKGQPDSDHVSVQTRVDFIDVLLRKAEPEVNGTYSKQRERHAKTLEIAQEEVLTCVGMVMYERLRQVYISLREEERSCQVLAAVAVHAIYRSFDKFVEKKQGISNLELLYQEISREEKLQKLKREQKKLKKKKKRSEKKCNSSANMAGDNEEEAEEEVDAEAKLEEDDAHHERPLSEMYCDDCKGDSENCQCERHSDSDVCAKSIDAGYGSDPLSHLNSRTSSVVSTPEGSEVSCSDGFCNHDHANTSDLGTNYKCHSTCSESDNYYDFSERSKTLSLQQMLDDYDDADEEPDYYIPDDVVMDYKYRACNIAKIRQEFREKLRQNFAQMCMRRMLSLNNCN